MVAQTQLNAQEHSSFLVSMSMTHGLLFTVLPHCATDEQYNESHVRLFDLRQTVIQSLSSAGVCSAEGRETASSDSAIGSQVG